MAKVKIDSDLLARAKKMYEAAGYSSLEELVNHAVEKEIAKHETDEAEDKVSDQLRGLGYID